MTTAFDIKNDEMDTIHRAIQTFDYETLFQLADYYARKDDMENAERFKKAGQSAKAVANGSEHEQTKWERDGEHREREAEDRQDIMMEPRYE